MCQPLPRERFILRARHAVVAVGVDGDTAARQKLAPHLDVLRRHQADEILHDNVHAVLVKVAVIAEAEQIELERLALDHPLTRDIGDGDRREIGLTRDGAQAREFGTVEFDEVVVFGVLVDKGLQHRGVIVGRIAHVLVTQ